jgi:hypothetical protein
LENLENLVSEGRVLISFSTKYNVKMGTEVRASIDKEMSHYSSEKRHHHAHVLNTSTA